MKLFRNYRKLIGAVLFIAVGAFPSCSKSQERDAGSAAEVQAEVATAEMNTLSSDQSFTGTVKSEIRSEIATKIMGEVQSVAVSIGEKVSKGDIILNIKDDNLEARKKQVQSALEEANIRLNSIERDYERYKVLYEKGSATQKEWDDIQANYEAAKARVDATESQLNEIQDLLSYTRIKAPYDGVIAAKYIEEGDIARPGMPLLALEQRSQFKIQISVPESEISSVDNGDTVQVQIPAAGLHDLSAKITDVSVSGSPQSRQFLVEMKLLNSTAMNNLRSGMFAEVSLLKQAGSAIMVPEKALVKRGQLVGVYTLNSQDEALLRWIRTGKQAGDQWEVLSGLKAGERYVADGSAIPHDGVKVNANN